MLKAYVMIILFYILIEYPLFYFFFSAVIELTRDKMILILTWLHGRQPVLISLATVRCFSERAVDSSNGLHWGVFLRQIY